MEGAPFSSVSPGNRESFRRSLQNSLSDALNYIGGGLDHNLGAAQAFNNPPSLVLQHHLPRQLPASLSVPNSNVASSAFLAQHHLQMTRSGYMGDLPNAQSPGGTSRPDGHHSSLSALGAHASQAVAVRNALLSCAEKQIVKAQTAVLLQQIALEKEQQTLRDALLVRLIHSRGGQAPAPASASLIPQAEASVADNSITGLRANGGGMSLPPQDSIRSAATPKKASVATNSLASLSIEDRIKLQKGRQNAYTLHALGNHLRSRHDPFIDCIDIEDPNDALQDGKPSSYRRCRGGVSQHFPERLHQMLLDVEDEGLGDIVSFCEHGRAFIVHDMDRFASEIMPKHFKQSKWNSFARQLSLYGFTRLANGPDAGGYYHELFLRSRPGLCLHMRRVGVPQGTDRRKCRPKNVAELQEPDFYSMKKSVRVSAAKQN